MKKKEIVVKVTFWNYPSLWRAAGRAAKRRGMSRSKYIRFLIRKDIFMNEVFNLPIKLKKK